MQFHRSPARLSALISLMGLFFALTSAASESPSSKSVAGLLERLVGERAHEFVLEDLSNPPQFDAYEVEAAPGRVVVRGTSPVAVARGIYDYLRHACNCQVTWSGRHLELPAELPRYSSGRISCPNEFRLYYNVCAFGYTTAFWDWPRWEQELDWMALHGINMPLAMAGQEAIWKRVWKSFGVGEEDLAEYFTGPAFLPWHRMGNVNKHDGPIPESFLEGQRELQKKILRRMREFGMTPVVPSFSGFVPKALGRLYPEAGIRKLDPWAGFPQDFNTYILSPSSPLFEEIGRRFIRAYREEYGSVQYYLADSFNELKVPVSQEHRYEELAAYGESVYKSILAGDPQGIWVMQGWLFFNDHAFWDAKSVQALLSRVPNERMVIIDLANEMYQGWKEHAGFYGKKWIYSIIHNFGGNNPMHGDLAFCATRPAQVLREPQRGAQLGFGMSPEGIENNEVIYELLTDAAWSEKEIDLNAWLKSYCLSRYGAYPPEVQRTWEILSETAYRNFSTTTHFGFQSRPSLSPGGSAQHDQRLGEAARSFLAASAQLKGNELYRNDLVEIAVQYAGLSVDRLLSLAGTLHMQGEARGRDSVYRTAFHLIGEIDALLDCRPDRRLSRWTGFARKWAKDEAEQAYYDRDARRQVTVWGGPDLSEYASKLWSGLVGGYYEGRWKLYAESLRTGQPMNLAQWEESWIRSGAIAPAPAEALDPVVLASGLLADIEASRDLSSLLKTLPAESSGGTRVGLQASVFLGSFEKVPDVSSLSPASREATSGFDISIAGKEEDFAIIFKGYLKVDTAGVYTFWTLSDDGSLLYLGGTRVVDNDGLHAPEEREGAAKLQKGFYPIRVSYFQRKGAKALRVLYSGPGILRQEIPPGVLSSSEN